MTQTATAPTDRQLAFLYKLAGERVAPRYGTCGEERIENLGALIENNAVTKRQVSQWIDWFTRQPKDSAAADQAPRRESSDAEVTVGAYEVDGQVYVVKPNRGKTRLYAKRMVVINAERLNENGEHVRIEFEYERGAIFRLTPAHRLGVERCQELSLRYGRCIMCGRALKAAKSVERMIGPVCYGYIR